MRLPAFVLLATTLLAAVAAADDVPLRVTPVPEKLKLDPFYKKYVSANGYPVVGSAKVSDYAMLEAGYLINMMLSKRPDVREAMIKSGSRMIVMAHDEFTTDVPEHKHMKPKDYWDRRARGLGGSKTDPVCSCGEENLLGFRGDPYHAECILIHEFAHNIHLRGVVNVDPTFDGRLKAAYKAAMKKGLWKDKYAAMNHHEYFAEGVQSWFDNNRPPDHDHNHVNTREELKAYDPALAAFCEEIFGKTVLKYTKPATRLTGHMAGYDPAKAPTFRWPERLKKLGEEIRKKTLAKRRRKAVSMGAKKQPIIGFMGVAPEDCKLAAGLGARTAELHAPSDPKDLQRGFDAATRAGLSVLLRGPGKSAFSTPDGKIDFTKIEPLLKRFFGDNEMAGDARLAGFWLVDEPAHPGKFNLKAEDLHRLREAVKAYNSKIPLTVNFGDLRAWERFQKSAKTEWRLADVALFTITPKKLRDQPDYVDQQAAIAKRMKELDPALRIVPAVAVVAFRLKGGQTTGLPDAAWVEKVATDCIQRDAFSGILLYSFSTKARWMEKTIVDVRDDPAYAAAFRRVLAAAQKKYAKKE